MSVHRRSLLTLALCLWLAGCASPPPADPVATAVAVARAVAATLTNEAATLQPPTAPAPTALADPVATGVALEQAIAATLTAAAPTATPTAIILPSPVPDLVATAVAVEQAVAATLAAVATAERAPEGEVQKAAPPPSPPSPLLSPTPSSAPTSQPAPAGPTPSPSPPIPPPPNCFPWSTAAEYVGAEACICGAVVDTYDSPSSTAFFINFSTDRTGYYAVSFDHTFAGLVGKCVQICGPVETYNGRPQTIIRDPGQIQEIPACP